MTLLILGLLLFVGIHAFSMARGQRAALIARIGEGPYKGLYSLLSLAGIVLIAIGFGQYRGAGYIPVWNPPVWTRHLALLLVWLRLHLLRRRLSAGTDQGSAQAPDAGRRETLGAGASSGQWRPRLDPAVRLHSWSGPSSPASARNGGMRSSRTARRAAHRQDFRNDALAVVIGTVAYVVFSCGFTRC